MTRLRHTPMTLLSAFVLIVALFVATPSVASGQGTPVRDTGMESGFLASLNAQRAARGVAPLVMNASMSGAAAQWAFVMADGTFLSHAGDIVTGTPAGWTKVGENVGRGKTVASLTEAFMNSPSHARNVLDPEFTHIGIGVYVHPSGRVYTTHRFAALPGSALEVVAPQAPTAPPPPPTPAPAPAPPEPTPTPVPPTPQPTPVAPAADGETATQEVAAAVTPPDHAGESASNLGEPPEELAFVDVDSTGLVDGQIGDTPLPQRQHKVTDPTSKAELKARRLRGQRQPAGG